MFPGNNILFPILKHIVPHKKIIDRNCTKVFLKKLLFGKPGKVFFKTLVQFRSIIFCRKLYVLKWVSIDILWVTIFNYNITIKFNIKLLKITKISKEVTIILKTTMLLLIAMVIFNIVYLEIIN